MGPVLRLHDAPQYDLSSAVAEFLADCRLRGLSPRTVEWYKHCLGPFLRSLPHGEDTEVEAVTEAHVRTFLAEQSTRVQPRRVNHYREAVYRLYDWLIGQGYSGQNPAERVRKTREPKKLTQTLSEQEVQALLVQPDQRSIIGLRDYVFMLTLLDTGIRLSEALGLEFEDIDLDNGMLTVMGKGSKERVVGFSAVLEAQLQRYLVRLKAALADIGRHDASWVFPNQEGGKWNAKTVQRKLKRYAAAAGIIRVRVSPHTFRHTFAVWFVRNGGSPFHLQKILGHSSLDMSRRYCELADVDFVEKQQALSPLTAMGLCCVSGSLRGG